MKTLVSAALIMLASFFLLRTVTPCPAGTKHEWNVVSREASGVVDPFNKHMGMKPELYSREYLYRMECSRCNQRMIRTEWESPQEQWVKGNK